MCHTFVAAPKQEALEGIKEASEEGGEGDEEDLDLAEPIPVDLAE